MDKQSIISTRYPKELSDCHSGIIWNKHLELITQVQVHISRVSNSSSQRQCGLFIKAGEYKIRLTSP